MAYTKGDVKAKFNILARSFMYRLEAKKRILLSNGASVARFRILIAKISLLSL